MCVSSAKCHSSTIALRVVIWCLRSPCQKLPRVILSSMSSHFPSASSAIIVALLACALVRAPLLRPLRQPFCAVRRYVRAPCRTDHGRCIGGAGGPTRGAMPRSSETRASRTGRQVASHTGGTASPREQADRSPREQADMWQWRMRSGRGRR